MARDPYRSSAGDLGRERWDRERFEYERDRDRYGDERVRFEEEDDHVYSRGPRDPPPRRGGSGVGRGSYDDEYARPERRGYYDDLSPVTAEFDRKVTIEKERGRFRSPSPPRAPRPGMLVRRQSSLDTFDRRPTRPYDRPDPRPRDDFRPPLNEPIPLPRNRGPRRYGERDSYDEIRVSDPDYYGDDEFRPYPERVREKEIVRTRRRDWSPSSRTSHSHSHGHRPSTRSSSTSSRSSSSSGGTAIKSGYPKKGKTRIPGRLVSKRALDDLGYPWIEEGTTIVVLKALGQDNIDDVLKLSEDYKKSELEVNRGRRYDDVVEERREEIVISSPVPDSPLPPFVPRNPAANLDVVKTTTVIRDVSPSRSLSTATSSRTPIVIDARPFEVSDTLPVGPLALVPHRHRSHSRGERVLRAEIRDLEHQLARRDRRSDRDVVTAERLSNGELVLYEERVERIEEPRRGVRIEKDKKGPPPGLVRAMLATLT